MGQVFSGSVDGGHRLGGRLGKPSLGVQEKLRVSEDLGDRGAELVVDRFHQALAQLTVTSRCCVLCGDVLDHDDAASDVTVIASQGSGAGSQAEQATVSRSGGDQRIPDGLAAPGTYQGHAVDREWMEPICGEQPEASTQLLLLYGLEGNI